MSGLAGDQPMPQQAMLDMHVQPGPTTISVRSQPVPDGTKVVILHIEHTAGNTVVFLDSEFAKAIGKNIIEAGIGPSACQAG